MMKKYLMYSNKLIIFCYSLKVVFFKTLNFMNGEYEVKCGCDECLMTLRDVSLLLSKADNFSDSESAMN